MKLWWERFIAWINEDPNPLDAHDCDHSLLYAANRRDHATGYEYACGRCGSVFLDAREVDLLQGAD